MNIRVRNATLEDAPFLAEGNARMALETERLTLDPGTLQAGVAAALVDSEKGRYFVADVLEAGHTRPAGMLMVTLEWSDWRNGFWWWIQSVYVHSEYRRQGVFRALYRYTQEQARLAGAVGLRLYVEKENAAAQATYRGLGMSLTHYLLMEDRFPGPLGPVSA